MGSGYSLEYVPPTRSDKTARLASLVHAKHGTRKMPNVPHCDTSPATRSVSPVHACASHTRHAAAQGNEHDSAAAAAAAASLGTHNKLLGKQKYVRNYGALTMDHRISSSSSSSSSSNGNSKDNSCGTLLLFCQGATQDLTFAYRHAETESVYAAVFTDAQITQAKLGAHIPFPWPPFFKSIAAAILKSRAVIHGPSDGTAPGTVTVSFVIVHPKETTSSYPFDVQLGAITEEMMPHSKALSTYVLEPLTKMVQQRYISSRMASHNAKNNNNTNENDHNASDGADNNANHDADNNCSPANEQLFEQEQHVIQLATSATVYRAAMDRHRRIVDRLLPLIRPLREESVERTHASMNVARELHALEQRPRRLRDAEDAGQRVYKHPLDTLYDEGGAQYFEHVPWAPPHHPHRAEPNRVLTACIRAAFPLAPSASLASISSVLARSDLQAQVRSSRQQEMIEEAFEIFKGIDRWDYDNIQLEIITNGNALFYTTYLLMYKLDLVSYFGIDDEVLCNFLTAVQSSYHPNPYHNAMHGTDVTQICYYIIMVAGVYEKCRLTKEDLLSSIVASVTHDFDHPGLNNNFHTRTNSYLATLYNDKSILENHHVACVFELMRHPRYNIFASLSDAQRQSVRETVVEMVLSTDMGNHAKIMKQFQMRMSEMTDWSEKKEDARLALCISIKMADISNCARPNNIYSEWAGNICQEFYLQGDVERSLSLSVSPFMDRTKPEDFPKGQMSFMTYIIQPMLETVCELLPSLRFALDLCKQNKDYWKQKVSPT